jgi:hypothetical protein
MLWVDPFMPGAVFTGCAFLLVISGGWELWVRVIQELKIPL